MSANGDLEWPRYGLALNEETKVIKQAWPRISKTAILGFTLEQVFFMDFSPIIVYLLTMPGHAKNLQCFDLPY